MTTRRTFLKGLVATAALVAAPLNALAGRRIVTLLHGQILENKVFRTPTTVNVTGKGCVIRNVIWMKGGAKGQKAALYIVEEARDCVIDGIQIYNADENSYALCIESKWLETQ